MSWAARADSAPAGYGREKSDTFRRVPQARDDGNYERQRRQNHRSAAARRGTDGAVFNPKTMEAFSSQGDGTLTVVKENSPTSFVVEQTVTTPVRAKTLTLDSKTNQILLITAEYTPPPAPSAGRPRGAGRWFRTRFRSLWWENRVLKSP